jgi:hypothetical protein
MPKGAELYERDFFLWTQEQAAALRRAKNSNCRSIGRIWRRKLRGWGNPIAAS